MPPSEAVSANTVALELPVADTAQPLPMDDTLSAPIPAAPVQPMEMRVDPRRRLRELLSVPERDRSDAQWDEIVELEIQMAPGNRVGPGPSSIAGGGTGGNTRHAAGGASAGPKKVFFKGPGARMKRNRPPKPPGA
jgi:hypothetical protein